MSDDEIIDEITGRCGSCGARHVEGEKLDLLVDGLPVHELSAVNGHCVRFKYSATPGKKVTQPVVDCS